MEESKQKVEEQIKEKTPEQIQKEMMEVFKDNEMMNLAETALQNNEIEFTVDNQIYRVRKATFSEKQDANRYRMKKYVELLKDPDCLLEKDLIKLYKNKGIDIEKFDKEVQALTKQQQTLMFELGKAIKENKPETELIKYKTEINNLVAQVQKLTTEKQQYVEFSLENRIIMEVYSYLIWLTSEKKVNDKWEKIWKTHEEFLSYKPDELLMTVTKNGAVILTEESTI